MIKSNRTKKWIYLAGIAIVIGIAIFFVKQGSSDINSVVRRLGYFSGKKADFEIEIEKISVRAPILVGVDPASKDVYNASLTKGVAHMNGTAMPGENGNVFIYGHSSSDIKSPYDKIFARLNELTTGDRIILNRAGLRYNYSVTDKKIVAEDDLSVLSQTDDKRLTLMTCWPIGTTDERLIVIAEQI